MKHTFINVANESGTIELTASTPVIKYVVVTTQKNPLIEKSVSYDERHLAEREVVGALTAWNYSTVESWKDEFVDDEDDLTQKCPSCSAPPSKKLFRKHKLSCVFRYYKDQ